MRLTVLSLFQELGESDSAVEERLSGCVKIRAKLSKGSHLTILGQLQLHGASNLRNHHKQISLSASEKIKNLFHGLDLSSGADTTDREADVDGWSDSLVEQLSLQENLAISD